jgi:hypothetical protein
MKISKKQMLTAAVMLAAVFFMSPLKAQVTIGELTAPDKNVVLDLRSNTKLGVLPPRVALTSTTSTSPMTVTPVTTGTTVFNTVTAGDVTPGYYYWDGTLNKWIRVGSGAQWFYMPSFNLPVTVTGTGLTYNLYNEYLRQFTKTGNAQFVSSNPAAATATEQTIYTAAQLDYIVTAYPSTVLTINSIDATGLMNYDVLSTNIPEGSFINVVFVVK